MDDLDHLIKLRPHLQYARDIVDGNIVSGKYVHLACMRSINEHLADVLDTNKDFRWTYKSNQAQKVVDFCALVPHVGNVKFRDKTFELPPWQLYFVSELYGWRSKEIGRMRRFTKAYLEVAKKNGKSSLAAVLALYELIAGDDGGQIYCAAATGDQSKIVWKKAKDMILRLPPKLRARYTGTGSEITTDLAEFKYLNTAGSAAANLDGLDPSFMIYDEAANILVNDVIEKPTYGMVARESPLRLMITHAQYATTSIYYEEKQDIIKSLEGSRSIDYIEQILALFYAVDDKEDIDDEANWIKANPNLYECIELEKMRANVLDAMGSNSNTKKRPVYTYNFCLWLSAADRWLEHEALEKCKIKKITKSEHCVIGVDLSTKEDLTVVARIWPRAGKWYCDFKCWTTSAHVDSLPNELKTQYEDAEKSKILVIQDGETLDLQEVYKYIMKTTKKFDVLAVGIDPNQASKMINNLSKKGVKTVTVSQHATTLNEITRETEAKILNGSFKYDGNPFIDWQFSNAVAHTNSSECVKIKKPKGLDHYKIDAVDALITGAFTIQGASQPESGGGLTVTIL